MSERYEIRIAGVGGQGAMLAGLALAEAAIFYDNKYAIQSPTYTSQVRGGPTKADVIISDVNIEFPRTMEIDFFLALDQSTYNKYGVNLKKDAVVLVDINLVPNTADEKHKIYKLPITQIAKEELGKVVVANVVAMGAIAALTDILSMDAIEKAVLKRVPKAFLELNRKALKLGYARASELK